MTLSALAHAPTLTFRNSLGTCIPDQPVHHLVCGDNLAAAESMRHLNSTVDIVYLDPPYNTGNAAFDRYHDGYLEDWVDFMRPRVQAAHALLSASGIVMVAIGDTEHHRLRCLLDEVFGPKNFISNIVWQGSTRPDSRWVSNGAEYMVVYAKSHTTLKRDGIRWREPRPGVPEILVAAGVVWTAATAPCPLERALTATAALKAWQRCLPKSHPSLATGLRDYNKIDEFGDVYRYGPVEKPKPGPYRYDVLHPVTGLPVPLPGNGWRMPEVRMAEAIAASDVVFGDDHTVPLRGKLRLRGLTDQVPRSVFESPRSRGATHLRDVLGADLFPYPKDHEVLARWIQMAAPADALVIDLFGGSGSTLEAVLRLNERDGGTRRCVLVTNNEVGADDQARCIVDGTGPGDVDWEALGVFEQVTLPRFRTILDGVRPDGSLYVDTVSAHIEVYAVEERVAPNLRM